MSGFPEGRGLLSEHMAVWFVILLSAVFSSGCISSPPESGWRLFHYAQPRMGSDFVVKFYAPDEAVARRAAAEVFERVDVLNGIFSDYEPESELSRLTGQPAGQPVKTSLELFSILQRGQMLARETDGAFDITIGPYTQLWRESRRQKRLAVAEELQAAGRVAGHKKLQLDPNGPNVTCLVPNMRLDLGGIAKGWAADEALAVLSRHGIHRALCAASGDFAIGGPPPGRDGWPVKIPTLDQQGNLYERTFRLSDCAVSTSGDMFQFVEIGGHRYSHIVDPRTGVGLTNRVMVTVIAVKARETDCQATAISVLGMEKGMQHADNNGLAVIITPLDGENRRPRISREWRRRFE